MHVREVILHNLDWENLKYILMVSKAGSIGEASRQLKVDRTTVLRRINLFEQQLGVQLFDRHRSGYALAPGAEQALRVALQVEDAVNDLQRQMMGQTMELEGELRVTTTDALLISSVSPHLSSFQQAHPKIRVDLVITNHRLSLTNRDADVSIRPAKNLPSTLVGYQLSEIQFAVYGSIQYLERNKDLKFDQHNWLGVDDPLTNSPPGMWMSNHVPNARISLKADSFVALKVAAEAGLGLTVLPKRLAETSLSLTVYGPELKDLNNGLWIATHPDLLRSARVNAFIEHFRERFTEKKN